MNATQTPSAMTIAYEADDPLGSFQRLFKGAMQNLTDTIDYYEDYAFLCRIGSVFSRLFAVVAGTGAAVLLNPLVYTMVPYISAKAEPEVTAVQWASMLAIAAGGVLLLDFAFGFTRKYTNWNVVAFELAYERAEFAAAFRKVHLSENGDLSAAAFGAARSLADETFKEFRAKQLEETQAWASNTQNAFAELRTSTTALQETTQTAATTVSQKADAAAETAGLTVTVTENDDRKGKTLQIVTSSTGGAVVWKQKVTAGVANSTFLPQGKYMVTLQVDEVEQDRRAVSLDGDKTVEI